jgi:ribosomal protein L31
MTQTAQQGNKHNFEVIARCNNGGTYSLNSTTASTNIIMDISTPAAPTYTGPASFSHNVYQVVNFTHYCPSNTDLVNGTFVSNLSSTGNIWGPHPFGFNDHWTNLEGRTLTATYWGTYQCQTSFKASAVSPQGVRQVPVYSG